MVASLTLASPVLAETPQAQAARLAGEAAVQEAEAAAEQPPPELTLDVWRVPVKRPYDVPAADMIRLGIEQELLSSAERDALRRTARLRAEALRVDAQSRDRALGLRLRHALADAQQVESSHRVHQAHLALAERTLALAKARYAAGGALVDATQAEIEVARARAELAADTARQESAAHVVATLQAAGANPAPLALGSERPELASLRLSREAELVNAEGERARSNWPDFRVGVSYFAPTTGRDEHGFGITLGMKLPWLWGAQSGRARAALTRAQAIDAERGAKLRELTTDAAVARGQLQAAESSLRVTREETLPLSQRAQTLAQSSYEAGGRLDETLRAAALELDTEMEIVRLEAEIAHMKIDLEYLEAGTSRSSQEVKHVR